MQHLVLDNDKIQSKPRSQKTSDIFLQAVQGVWSKDEKSTSTKITTMLVEIPLPKGATKILLM